ncbi:MAG: hypothetical protein HOQ35_15430 [Acidobacteriaceae bacterium]|nr:hypothetical protein [Acidobacteriaceae bacterium]
MVTTGVGGSITPDEWHLLIVAGDPGEHAELFRVFDGQGIEENFFCDSENGGIGADAQSEGSDGDEGKRWVTAELTHAEAEIASKIGEGHDRAHLSLALLQEGCIAELTARRRSGLFRTHTLANVSLRQELQVQPHLVVEFVIGFSTAEHSAELCRENTESGGHHGHSFGQCIEASSTPLQCP